LPVQQVTKVELIINMKTALGQPKRVAALMDGVAAAFVGQTNLFSFVHGLRKRAGAEAA
jgi:hypothetical protein